MDALCKALYDECMEKIGSLGYMTGLLVDYRGAAKVEARRLWWDGLAGRFECAQTTSFGVSSTGLRVLWRCRVDGRKLEASVALSSFVGPRRNASLVEELLRKMEPYGHAEALGRSWYVDPVAVMLLEACERRGTCKFFEDAFRMAEEWSRKKDPASRRRGIDREAAVSELRTAVRKYFNNGGDADELRSTVDEEIVARVLGS